MSSLVQVIIGDLGQQAIIWADDDSNLGRHMTTLGHDELNVLHTYGVIAIFAYDLVKVWVC